MGSAIYVGWRSTDLLVFRWIESLKLSPLLVRPGWDLPEWMLYSFPDGCWVYAITSWMLIIWLRVNAWVVTGFVLAVASEIGQLLSLVPGSFDALDLFFYFLGFAIPVVLHEKKLLVRRRTDNDVTPGHWKC
jgi:hypothetical protein